MRILTGALAVALLTGVTNDSVSPGFLLSITE